MATITTRRPHQTLKNGLQRTIVLVGDIGVMGEVKMRYRANKTGRVILRHLFRGGSRGKKGKGMGKGRGREDKRKGKKLLLLRIEPLYKFLLLRDRRLHVKKLFTFHANTLNAVSI